MPPRRISRQEFDALTPTQRIERFCNPDTELPIHPALRQTPAAQREDPQSIQRSYDAASDHEQDTSSAEIEYRPDPEPDYAARAARVRQALAEKQQQVAKPSGVVRRHSIMSALRRRSQSFSVDDLIDRLKPSKLAAKENRSRHAIASQGTLLRTITESAVPALQSSRSQSPMPKQASPKKSISDAGKGPSSTRRQALQLLSANTKVTENQSRVAQAKAKIRVFSKKVKKTIEVWPGDV